MLISANSKIIITTSIRHAPTRRKKPPQRRFPMGSLGDSTLSGVVSTSGCDSKRQSSCSVCFSNSIDGSSGVKVNSSRFGALGTTLRSDNDQHRFDVAALLVNLIERSLLLLFPENQLECLRRSIIEQFPVFKHRRDFGHARSATLLCRARAIFCQRSPR